MSTPTPERLLQELYRRANLPKDAPDRAHLIGIRWILRLAADLIRTRTAERDALAAVLAEAPHYEYCASIIPDMFGTDGRPRPECDCVKAKLPTDALADRDAEKWDEGARAAHDRLRARVADDGTIDQHALIRMPENPYRIEREAGE